MQIELSLPNRVSPSAWLLGAALAVMSMRVVGVPLGLAAQPAMDILGRHANPLVMPAATLIQCVVVCVVLLVIRWGLVHGAAKPGSILARNESVFVSGRVVALVALAECVVDLAAYEIRWFFEIPFASATQLDMLSPQGQVFTTVVLPAVGIATLILLAPRVVASGAKG
jgi:hypothetical protein